MFKRGLKMLSVFKKVKIRAFADQRLACITGALWAKRGERGIVSEARDEGRGKIKCWYQSIFLALPPTYAHK